MKMCALLQKGTNLDPKTVNSCKALELATINGAISQGREGQIGQIKEGLDASMVVLDLDTPMLTPVHNPISTAVYSACGRDVYMTMVRGKILYQNGQFPTIDLGSVVQTLTEYAIPTLFREAE